MKKMALGLVIGMSIVGAAVFAQNISGGPASEIPYQGRLEQNGLPADGPVDLEFYLVRDEALAIGDAIWTETHVAVPVNAGIFSVSLGETNPLTNDVLAEPELWVGVQVAGVDLAGKQRLGAVAYSLDSNGTPPGTVMAFAGTTVPSGWLICDGRNFQQTSFPRLAAAIGTIYGSNGSGQFRLPDLRGRMPLGLDNQGGVSAGRVVAATADSLGGANGRERTTQVIGHAHALQADGVHDHTMPDSCNQGTQCGGGGDGFVRGPRNTNVDFWIGDNGSHDHGGATLAAGTQTTLDNMPPYLGLRYMIKY